MKIIKIERDPEKSGIAYPAFKVTIKKWRPFKGWIESTDYYKDSGYEYVLVEAELTIDRMELKQEMEVR